MLTSHGEATVSATHSSFVLIAVGALDGPAVVMNVLLWTVPSLNVPVLLRARAQASPGCAGREAEG
eukprot:scaffold6498_cov162-Pinguiococcus_pyrenoidosus.AAC.1